MGQWWWITESESPRVFRKVACLTVCSVTTFLETERTQLQKSAALQTSIHIETFFIEYMREREKKEALENGPESCSY
jgi:hypothetical protein